ncbi:hypothetical protein KPH14_010640 [Odynerus spinipes]|uniref:Pseudouridine synthase II N-terminal domain-containing protein n=1 Tax=Odynerus spinipes TaxID=1348599 RepID=A0AAD9RVB4_9HYME|nr:hypothetical protein KPH14_010640 [Odynerus spinipes]
MQHYICVRSTILQRLCTDLNEMKVRPPDPYISIEGETTTKMRVITHPNYADDPLVVGPRYQEKDIKFAAVNRVEIDTCGVLIFGINKGTKFTNQIRESRPTRCYRLKGILGQATNTHFKTGKIVEKSTYKHVKRSYIDKICASMQSSHQKKMFELCGVDLQSQAAYELAAKGLVRPANTQIPILYEIKCIDFQPPEFMLEIVCINEDEQYLKTLIHELGLELHTTATCTLIQCFKYGLFDLQHALLSKQWDLESILNNIQVCREILRNNKYLLEQTSPTLVENNQ